MRHSALALQAVLAAAWLATQGCTQIVGVDSDWRLRPDPSVDDGSDASDGDSKSDAVSAPGCTGQRFRCTGVELECEAADQSWLTVAARSSAALCDALDGLCHEPVCSVGDARCAGAELEACNADRTGYTSLDTCVTPELCDATAGKCDTPVCEPGELSCDERKLMECNSGRTGWDLAQNCAPKNCNADTGSCE